MAQVLHAEGGEQIVHIPNANHATSDARRDKVHARAFRDLDGPLHELRHMAGIAFDEAEGVANSIIAKREIDGRQYERMMFAVGHIGDMIAAMQSEWDDRLREGFRQR